MTRSSARTPVAVALGSNIGDRRGHLDYAVSRLGVFLHDIRVSTYYETAPVDVVGEQWDFLNAAAVGDTESSAREVLDALLAIEASRGWPRQQKKEPRTLDLDIILFGNQMIEEPGLIVPHPRFRDRRFVLDPLAEIAADWRDPTTGKTVAELRDLLTTT